MADLRLPLPPALAADPRFTACALAVQDELDRIGARLPSLLVTAIDAIDDPGVLAHLAWQWHVMGVEGWDYVADTPETPDTLDARRELVRDAIELHRYKGTPWAVRTALARTMGLAATVEEADALRRTDGAVFSQRGGAVFSQRGGAAGGRAGGWADYQIDPGRALARPEAAATLTVATAWAPVRSRLARLYHGWDLRAARYDLPMDRRCLWDDWSGVDLDGVRQSFGTVHAAAGLRVPAADGAAGAVVAAGLRFHRDPLRRWDLWPLDGAAEATLTVPAQMSVQSSRGARPNGARSVPARWALPRAVLADGVPYDSLHGIFDGWAMAVEDGPAPRYDGPSGYDAATAWRWLRADARRVDAAGVATPARASWPMPTPALAVETAIHFSPNARVQRYDLADEAVRQGRTAGRDATGEDFGRRPAPWGTGPWLDQPWGNSSAGVTMEVMA